MFHDGEGKRKGTRAMALVAVVLMGAMNSQLFLRLPHEEDWWKVHALYLFGLVCFFYYYLLTVLLKKQHNVGRLAAPFLLYLAVLVIPVVTARFTFDQPLLYGFLAQRSAFTVISALAVYLLLRSEILSVRDIVDCFLFLAWFSLVIFTYYASTLDPASLSGETSRLGGVSTQLGDRFNFNVSFIVFGCIYYFLRMSSKANLRHLLSFVAFFGYIVFIFKGRTNILVLLLLYGFIVAKIAARRDRAEWLNALVLLLLTIVLGSFVLLYDDNKLLASYQESFESIWQVMQGRYSDDSSANARIFQTRIILDYLRGGPERILFGTGLLSHKWNNAYRGIFGYLYPSDTGLLGGIFMFGLLDICLAFSLFLVVYRWACKAARMHEEPGIVAMKYCYLYCLLMSLTNIELLQKSFHVFILFAVFAYLMRAQEDEQIVSEESAAGEVIPGKEEAGGQRWLTAERAGRG